MLWAGMSGGSVSRALSLISESSENSRYDQLAEALINTSLSKNLEGSIRVWEEVAQFTRENQLSFCRVLLENIRRISFVRNNWARMPARVPKGISNLKDYIHYRNASVWPDP